MEFIEEGNHQLDAVFAEASSWRFATLGDGNNLVLDEPKTVKSYCAGSKHYSGHPAQGFTITRSELGFPPYKPRDLETELAPRILLVTTW